MIRFSDVITNMRDRLEKLALSYRPLNDNAKKEYRLVECMNCQWWGSSVLLDGGGAIADTGDFFDCQCPACHSSDIEDKEELTEEAVELIQYFVGRVEKGEVRSIITYKKFKDYLVKIDRYGK